MSCRWRTPPRYRAVHLQKIAARQRVTISQEQEMRERKGRKGQKREDGSERRLEEGRKKKERKSSIPAMISPCILIIHSINIATYHVLYF